MDALSTSQTIVSEAPTNIVTPSRADLFVMYKTGRFAQVMINNLAYSSSFSTDTKIATINHNVATLTRFSLYTSANAFATGFIKGDGEIYISNYTANALLYGSFTFMISD